ncbi:MAG: hypothetical protein HC857_17945 [Synechococcales cyanobacterium RU_4_20]|nr:hypothetical protein [Synechococcales cyanobacterium RU_4_20]
MMAMLGMAAMAAHCMWTAISKPAGKPDSWRAQAAAGLVAKKLSEFRITRITTIHRAVRPVAMGETAARRWCRPA